MYSKAEKDYPFRDFGIHRFNIVGTMSRSYVHR